MGAINLYYTFGIVRLMGGLDLEYIFLVAFVALMISHHSGGRTRRGSWPCEIGRARCAHRGIGR
jgi:hypothetical protein